MDSSTDLRRSPLDAAHRRLGAKMVPFGGWEMPLSYEAGTIAEHTACRHGAVVFDVSHLGTVQVSGPYARAALQRAFTNDLDKIEPGRAQYTHLLDPADASVLDDIIVWWIDDERFDVMPNASNTARVRESLTGADDTEAPTITDTTETRVVLAIQGPDARSLLGPIVPEAADVGRFRITRFDWQGVDCVAAGTGYTGEDGIECAVPADHAESFWEALIAAGIQPAGLGARDTLRLEAGLPLHGNELGPGVTPLQAGLGWVIGWKKDDFQGRAALAAERDAGVSRLLRGLAVEGRRPPRSGQTVLIGGERVGEVTSGNFSPELGHGIALAFMPPHLELGTKATIDVRGTGQEATIVETPFVGR